MNDSERFQLIGRLRLLADTLQAGSGLSDCTRAQLTDCILEAFRDTCVLRPLAQAARVEQAAGTG